MNCEEGGRPASGSAGGKLFCCTSALVFFSLLLLLYTSNFLVHICFCCTCNLFLTAGTGGESDLYETIPVNIKAPTKA